MIFYGCMTTAEPEADEGAPEYVGRVVVGINADMSVCNRYGCDGENVDEWLESSNEDEWSVMKQRHTTIP